ncbi:6604_t:CDS:10, partial [Racocetra fulgida]
ICIALYDYTAQNDDEISFKEDDILYILENDDDEWWKAKLKIEKSEDDENAPEGPIGIVPSNYIQEAECKSVLKAVYDYEAQSNEELSFKEEDIFYLYDKDDPDWYLVKFNDVFGYVPANYIEETSFDSEEQELQENQEPKKKMSLFDALSSASENKYVDPLQLYARKVATQKSGTSKSELLRDCAVVKWEVIVVDKKKKKKKGKLSIGGENVIYTSETDKTPVQLWNISDVESVKYEKKNVTITFGGAKQATFNFQVSNKSDAEAIYRQYVECTASLELPTVNIDTSSMKSPRPTSTHDNQDNEETESQADAEENDVEEVNVEEVNVEEVNVEEVNEMELPSPKLGIALYDFDAQGDDEISIREGDDLWIIDDVSSNEWWKCRKGDEEGMVPSSYIDIPNEDGNADQYAAEEERQRLEEEEYQRAEEERLRKEEERLRKEEERQRKEEERLRREEERQRKEDRQRKEEERLRREESERKRKELERQLSEEKKRKQESESPPPQPPALPNEAAIKKIQTPTNRILPDRPAQAQSKDNRTGSFQVEAEFLQLSDGKVHLHKLNGIKIAVPIDRMSKKDIAYLEGVTGEKLDDRSDNIPLAAIVAGHKGKTTLTNKNKSEYDWFDFFLKADITHDDAFKYAKIFINENMDESSINNLDRNVMKELGLKEGDIIRVTKYVSENYTSVKKKTAIGESKEREKTDREIAKKVQFEELEKSQKLSEFDLKMQLKRDEQLARELQEEENRIARSEGRTIPKDADLYGKGTLDSLIQRDDKANSPKTPPLLFSENNGVLKNNTKKARPTPTKTAPIQVDAKTFVNSKNSKDQIDSAFKPSSKSSSSTTQKFDDDAWSFTDSTPAPPPVVAPRSSLNEQLTSKQLISTNAPTNLNTSAWTSLSPAVSPYSSNSSLPVQSSQPLLQRNLITPSPPPSQPIAVPLNSTLHQPLIPVKSSNLSMLPTNNALSNPNHGFGQTGLSMLPTNNALSNPNPGFGQTGVSMLPTNNALSNPNPGFGLTGMNNQYVTTTTTVQYQQTTSFHQPMQNQQQTNSAIYDPKNVFASMKTGQIGPKSLPNDLSVNASNDRYAALKQVDLQGPGVFNSTSSFQTQSSTSFGLNPSGFNTSPANWNQGVPQQNQNFGVGGIQPNPGFGFGQQPGQFGSNQQGFGSNTGFNNNQQFNNFGHQK